MRWSETTFLAVRNLLAQNGCFRDRKQVRAVIVVLGRVSLGSIKYRNIARFEVVKAVRLRHSALPY